MLILEMEAISHPHLDLVYRPMQLDDLPGVLAIERQCHSHPWSEKQFQSSLESSHQCHIVLHQQQAVAHAVTFTAVDEAELLTLAVSPAYQRQGIARALVGFLLQQFDPRTQTLFLEVRVSNTAAIALYQSLGFNELGLRHSYYPAIGGGREDALLMALSTAC